MGTGAYINEFLYQRKLSFNTSLNPFQNDTASDFRQSRLYFFAEGKFPLGTTAQAVVGVRGIYTLNNQRFFPEPRLSISWNPSESLTINASAGSYHQFAFKRTHIDRNGNYAEYWTGSDTRPLSALHFVTGISYRKKQFMLNLESFFKPVNGISRTQFIPEEQKQIFWYGRARSYGIDLYARQDFGPHALWFSYTLSKTEEKLSSSRYQSDGFVPAPHDQRHEIKAAVIVKLGRFHLASNYVFGSGLELVKQIAEEQGVKPSYSRWDASLTYQFRIKKISGETGLSILNLLNRQNVRYPNLKKIDIKEYGNFSVYTQSLPFTPSLFLQIKF